MGSPNEAQVIPDKEWSTCTKEQVLNQLEVLSRKKLVPHARTRFKIIPSQGQDVRVPRSVLLGAYT
eukprot:8712536-Prorocentrum_lima.AAC.1